jgi:hypothetical protein
MNDVIAIKKYLFIFSTFNFKPQGLSGRTQNVRRLLPQARIREIEPVI